MMGLIKQMFYVDFFFAPYLLRISLSCATTTKNPDLPTKWKWLFNWYIFPTCYLIPLASHFRNWQAMRTPFDFGKNWPVLKSINCKCFLSRYQSNLGGRAFWMNIQWWRPQAIFPTRLHSFVTFVKKTTLIFCWLTHASSSRLLFNKCRKVVLNPIPQIKTS